MWSWRPDAGVKLAMMLLASWLATVAIKPVTGESAKETVKTIARGMPGVSGVTVVTNARVFYHHARLRAHQAPGIPCAL